MGRTVLRFNPGRVTRCYCSSERPNQLLGPTQHHIQRVQYRGSFLGVKRPWREIYYVTHPTNDEVKNEWSYTSTPHIHLNGVGRANIYIFLFIYLYILSIFV